MNSMAKEKDIQDAILDYLNHVLGLRAWRRNVGATISQYKGKKRLIRFNTKGMSDIWFIGPNGIHGECEVKQVGESLTEAQSLFQTEVIRAGGIAFVAHSLKECASELETAYVQRYWEFKPSWRIR